MHQMYVLHLPTILVKLITMFDIRGGMRLFPTCTASNYIHISGERSQIYGNGVNNSEGRFIRLFIGLEIYIEFANRLTTIFLRYSMLMYSIFLAYFNHLLQSVSKKMLHLQDAGQYLS